jgi:16S rRNA processing protein RimM
LSSSTEPTPVARLGRPHGLEGFLGLYVHPDDLRLFPPGATVIVGVRELTVRSVRQGPRGPQIAFQEITDRTGAEEMRNLEVFVAGTTPVSEGSYRTADLIGLEVRPGGGVVSGVAQGPGQDRLVVERDGRSFEVPFVPDLVPVVDTVGGFVEIIEIEGLVPPSA